MSENPYLEMSPADDIHERLRAAVEVEQSSYLWVPEHSIAFTPRLLPVICGDGRALFSIATINQRPAYWIIRGCSTWGCGLDRDDSEGPDFAELTDDIMYALEDAFGRGRCGYCGNSLFHPREERIENCQCEECDDEYVAEWPEVDDEGGCSWSRQDWPDGFDAVPHPLSSMGNLLAITGAIRDDHA
ncbi:hypothetical protein [Novosphingobium sp.]|uniref:hypothetical protein n=1 Tax=Novosphingobium sp. TaxID=1874826 RepID=UPI0028B182D5|nr:hypothetical protein [Novosphingobium sp.]